MKLLLFISALVIGFLLIRKKGYERFELLFVASVFYPLVAAYPFSGLGGHTFFLVCCFISIVEHDEYKQIKKMPLIVLLLFMLASYS